MTDHTKRALRWVNTVRRRNGLEPLEEMRKGALADPFRCPIARSLSELHAVVRSGSYDMEGVRKTLPKSATDFIHEFDGQQLPGLIDIDARTR